MTHKPGTDSVQPWRNAGGLMFATGSDLTLRTAAALDPADQSPLANAIRETFPDSSPAYWFMIARRFRELYEGLTEEEAVNAVLKGYSSPISAIRSRVIRKRKYLGFGLRRLLPIGFKTWVLDLAWITSDPAGRFVGEMQFIFQERNGPKAPIASLESLLEFVHSRGGNDLMLDAAKGAWRRYELWAGVHP